MPLQWSRYTALLFAVGLGIGEVVINWGNWQFAPLWIVDYICVLWLLAGFYRTRNQSVSGQSIAVLLSGWAFTAGVVYMALFISLDPEVAKYNIGAGGAILILMGLMLVIAALGVGASFLAMRKSNPLPAPKNSVMPPEGENYEKS
ncbi:MAG TPA: hypothetical protein VG324_07230 [Blastocatellia bacterium]|nr:hypothetical protein [Blastocatellia bacterium]